MNPNDARIFLKDLFNEEGMIPIKNLPEDIIKKTCSTLVRVLIEIKSTKPIISIEVPFPGVDGIFIESKMLLPYIGCKLYEMLYNHAKSKNTTVEDLILSLTGKKVKISENFKNKYPTIKKEFRMKIITHFNGEAIKYINSLKPIFSDKSIISINSNNEVFEKSLGGITLEECTTSQLKDIYEQVRAFSISLINQKKDEIIDNILDISPLLINELVSYKFMSLDKNDSIADIFDTENLDNKDALKFLEILQSHEGPIDIQSSIYNSLIEQTRNEKQEESEILKRLERERQERQRQEMERQRQEMERQRQEMERQRQEIERQRQEMEARIQSLQQEIDQLKKSKQHCEENERRVYEKVGNQIKSTQENRKRVHKKVKNQLKSTQDLLTDLESEFNIILELPKNKDNIEELHKNYSDSTYFLTEICHADEYNEGQVIQDHPRFGKLTTATIEENFPVLYEIGEEYKNGVPANLLYIRLNKAKADIYEREIQEKEAEKEAILGE